VGVSSAANLVIRAERPADAAVNAECFSTDAEAGLVDLLREGGHLSVSLVAEVEGEIVGAIAFSPVSTAKGDLGIGLAPLAVREAHRRRGAGADLVTAGLGACRDLGSDWVVVLGDPGYYSRFGFRPATEYGLLDEYGGGEAFQALELRAGSLPVGAGLVRYSEEFGLLA
jgi:putative acetyltransferase